MSSKEKKYTVSPWWSRVLMYFNKKVCKIEILDTLYEEWHRLKWTLISSWIREREREELSLLEKRNKEKRKTKFHLLNLNNFSYNNLSNFFSELYLLTQFSIRILCRQVPTFAYEKRLSRIETLRLAITYISFMDEILTPGNTLEQSGSNHCSNNNSNNNNNNNSGASVSTPFRSPPSSHPYNMYPIHRGVCH